MENRVVALLHEAQSAARAGKKAKARRTLRTVLLCDPENVTALLWLGWLADDRRDSLAYIYRALARDPQNLNARAALDWVRRREDFPSAEEPPHQAGSSPQPAHGRWRRVSGVAIACLLVALVGGTQARSLPETPAAIAGPAYNATPTATPMPSPTPTPIPTWTPMPTPRPTKPPTRTPFPTATPTTTPTADLTGTPSLPSPPTLSPSSFYGDTRWIEVNLTLQVLNAYEGQELARTTFVSTGTQENPTPTGLFRIHTKMRYDDMRGPDYYLPNVPFVMYFHKGYGLHGTYWHANFGHRMSHGCVNIATAHAEWLFGWADVGTWVYIHE